MVDLWGFFKNHILSELLSEISIIYFKIKGKFSGIGINNESRVIEVIISLTTYPERFDFVYLTIESLLNQNIKPDKIILWLSKQETDLNSVPDKIKKLQKKGLTIQFTSERLKQYGKLIHTLEIFNHAKIITVDDDTLYPRNFVEKLLKTNEIYPDCIVAYRCHYMEKISDTKLSPYSSWKKKEIDGPSYNLFPTGVGGVLYPPNAFSEEMFNRDIFLKLCPLNDDIWFKAMALLNGKKTVMVYRKSVEFPTISRSKSQQRALWRTNVKEQKNDEQLKSVFDHYNLYQYVN